MASNNDQRTISEPPRCRWLGGSSDRRPPAGLPARHQSGGAWAAIVGGNAWGLRLQIASECRSSIYVFPAPRPIRLGDPAFHREREVELERGQVWVRWSGTELDLVDGRALAEFYLESTTPD